MAAAGQRPGAVVPVVDLISRSDQQRLRCKGAPAGRGYWRSAVRDVRVGYGVSAASRRRIAMNRAGTNPTRAPAATTAAMEVWAVHSPDQMTLPHATATAASSRNANRRARRAAAWNSCIVIPVYGNYCLRLRGWLPGRALGAPVLPICGTSISTADGPYRTVENIPVGSSAIGRTDTSAAAPAAAGH